MLKNFADYFGAEAARPRDYFETDWPGAQVVARRPGRHLPGPARCSSTAPRSASRSGSHPLGRHRDLDLLERLHGRRRALRRARRPRGARRAVRRAALDRRAGRCSRSVLAAAPAARAQRARFDTRLLARSPAARASPRWPTCTPTAASTRAPTSTRPATAQRSRVLEYDGDGTLLRSWTVPGQDLSKDHGVQVATSDSAGAARAARPHARAGAAARQARAATFGQYATFANLAPCLPLQAPSTAARRRSRIATPMANYGAWGPDGSLYVTDYLQGVVWRVPPGGGEARGLAGRPPPRRRRVRHHRIGLLGADRRTLLIGQGSSAGLGGLNPTTGKIYTVEIQPDGSPGALRQLWESGPADLPDGFAIARSGRLYVPLAGGGQPDRGGRARRPRARALPERRRRRGQRLARALRHSLERPLPRHPADRGQPELHRQPRQPGRCSTWRPARPACPS